MSAEHSGPGEVLVPIEIAIGAGTLRTRVPVPSSPTTASDLMPIFRSLSDAVVHLSVLGVEKQGKRVSCGEGCAACCRHLVPLSHTEARALLAMIDALPPAERSRLRDRFAHAASVLRSAGVAEPLLNPIGISGERQLEIGGEYYSLYLDCPFLEDERCTIYEQRPIVCREFLMTSPAENCRPLREPMERVPIAANTNRALLWLDSKPGDTQAPWVALAMLMEWAGRMPPGPEPEPGERIVRRVMERITDRGQALDDTRVP